VGGRAGGRGERDRAGEERERERARARERESARDRGREGGRKGGSGVSTNSFQVWRPLLVDFRSQRRMRGAGHIFFKKKNRENGKKSNFSLRIRGPGHS
jgi:hypothetical protein